MRFENALVWTGLKKASRRQCHIIAQYMPDAEGKFKRTILGQKLKIGSRFYSLCKGCERRSVDCSVIQKKYDQDEQVSLTNIRRTSHQIL